MSPRNAICRGGGVAIGLVLAFSACSDSIESPSSDPQLGITCQLGCIEQDSFPTAPGIFLGSGVDDVVCFNGSQTDSDQDGISDFCERNLAPAFAPQLALTAHDQVGREPHLAVRRLTYGKARMMYLLSYYIDAGPTTSWCEQNVIDAIDASICSGHDGDSEWITLDVYYNEMTKHWILDQAIYSQHEGVKPYSRGSSAYPAISYATKKGGAPRVYVAYQKHANYASDRECDEGALFGTDNCNASIFETATAGDNVNIRSRAVHPSTRDCMPSTNPIYADNGVEECYWTVRPFVGWHIGFPADNSDYSGKLAAMGF